MLILKRPFTDPYLNIAAEEYFVHQKKENICMLWTNEKSVIIGKHQNAYAEINYLYLKANKIPVIRRISGGGAVYHDPGNINFTFIQNADKNNLVDFGKFTHIIKLFMQSIGIDINISKRNSLFIGNKKFSGHAEHVFHDRVLHHGTILFNTDLVALGECLKQKKEYSGKAMTSVRSDVCNIAPLLPHYVDIHVFINQLTDWLKDYFEGSKSYELDTDDLHEISKLAGSKYKTWAWNFGYSPKYQFNAIIPTVNGTFLVLIFVENGKFKSIELQSETKNSGLRSILQTMIGVLHEEDEIDKFAEINKSDFKIVGIKTEGFGELFFT